MILWFNKFCTEPLQVYEHLSNCRGDHSAMWAPGFTAFAGSLSAVGRLLPRAPLSSLDATHFRCRCSTWCWEAVPACYCSAGLLWPHIMVGPYRWWSSEVDSLCSMCAWVHVCRCVCTYVNMYLDARRWPSGPLLFAWDRVSYCSGDCQAD